RNRGIAGPEPPLSDSENGWSAGIREDRGDDCARGAGEDRRMDCEAVGRRRGDNDAVDLKRPGRLVPEKFAPSNRGEVADFEQRLLTAVAHALAEQPHRDALSARSNEVLSLLDEVVDDWRAVVGALERNEPGDTTAQLRAVAQFSSDTLSDLVQG